MSALAVGDRAPEFTAVAHTGERLALAEMCRRGVVVLYFYPKDETPGCTVQARAFRDVFDEFRGAGATVIGVSHDSEERHRSFASNHGLPFLLVSDADGSLRRAYDVPRTMGLLPGRVTYVIDRDGVIRMIFNSQIRPGAHVRRALDQVRQLTAAAGRSVPDAVEDPA